ncbi:glycosyltransferase [Paraflavisolibacter sp. H34]|uniref:glycosyltransferase n=1 Tax=Huijunlia imazamoxiresistens TaxID=3127457 RepID=UPI00301B2A0D
MLPVTLIILLLYALLIFYYHHHWRSLEEPSAPPAAGLPLSVVVAARNEESAITGLLESLERQTYPRHLVEVVIVDDFSTDSTREVVARHANGRTVVVQPSVAPHLSSKKKAIEAGIHTARHPFVVITDADCLPPPQWLHRIAGFQQQSGAAFIAAPVKFTAPPTLLGIFQRLDFLTLQGITAASVAAGFHSMCNGANLAYSRAAFFEVDGFAGIDQVASGDDMLLMHKIWKKHPREVRYLKSREAIVETPAMPDWKGFLRQRIRWSSKTAHYDDHRVLGVLLFVYGFNCWFFVLLALVLWGSVAWWLPLLFVVAKTAIEWPFVFSVARFYGEQKLLKYFPFFQPLHIFYVVFIGLVSQLGTYEWKGRQTK